MSMDAAPGALWKGRVGHSLVHFTSRSMRAISEAPDCLRAAASRSTISPPPGLFSDANGFRATARTRSLPVGAAPGCADPGVDEINASARTLPTRGRKKRRIVYNRGRAVPGWKLEELYGTA